MTWDAIVLAGGSARRLGGLDKPTLLVGGRSMFDIVLAACAGARAVVVVGPTRPVERTVHWTVESPVGTGPLAALAAGLEVLPPGAEIVVVLAADLPAMSERDVARLVSLASGPVDGAVLVDDDGRDQPLAGAYRRAVLEQALTGIGDPRNRPLSDLVGALVLARCDGGAATRDVDTPEDLVAARVRWDSGPAGSRARHEEVALIEDWVSALCEALDVPADEVDVSAVLDLARDVAHHVDRPAAPVTAYIVGYAAGRRGGDAAAGEVAGQRARELAAAWEPPPVEG